MRRRARARRRISVLARQVALVRVQECRLRRLLREEEKSGRYVRAVTENIGLLQELYTSTLRIQQELDVEPAYLRTARPKKASSKSDGTFDDPIYSFLTPGEARMLSQIKKRVERGELNPIELYNAAAPLIELELRRGAEEAREQP